MEVRNCFKVRNCFICDKPFDPVREKQKTCSKECSVERGKRQTREWVKNNKDKVHAIQKSYYYRNREKVLKKYHENSDEINIKVRAYYYKNKERYKVIRKERREEIKEYNRLYYLKRKEKRLSESRKSKEYCDALPTGNSQKQY